MTLDEFRVLLNQPFQVDLDGGHLELTLVEAQALPDRWGRAGDGARRQSFSLLFRGPHTPLLPQRTYSLKHEQMAEANIFLVPIGPDAAGQRYEAIFN
jgi:hypothetical protein